MAKNLRTSLKQSIRASSKASLVGSNVFGSSPLDLRFALQKTLDPRVTFTRASSGTYVGSNGLIKSATTNEARFDHNPTTGESLGLLVEEARTNLLLNSATLSTQSATVTAVSTTLSFYGTGTVTLTGVSTAGPLVGTGANNRVSLTFTPTAGSLTLTVSGSVTNAQLEAGAFPTSYIPTTSATVTRAADVASITGTNFSAWYNQTEGTVFTQFRPQSTATLGIAGFDDDTNNNRWRLGRSSSEEAQQIVQVSGVNQVTTFISFLALNGLASAAASVRLNDCTITANGLIPLDDTSCTIPTVNKMTIGSAQALTAAGSTIRRLTYWPIRLPNATLQAITTS